MAKKRSETSQSGAETAPDVAGKVTVEFHALDQYEVLYLGRRVAYVAIGADKPINFLPWGASVNVRLTTAEKIAIAEVVRSLMRDVTAAVDADEARLAELVSGQPLPPA